MARVSAALAHPGEHAEGRTSHGRAVHAGGAGHLRPSQARRAEVERRTETALEFRLILGIQERGQHVAVGGVRVERDPRFYVASQLVVHRTRSTSDNNAPSEAAASWPASRTS